MFRSWKLGRFAGIDVFVHPTFLLVLTFPQVSDGGAEGLLLVLAVFGCVLLHEFGHALMARKYGIETADITLYPIGGVARLERMPRSPGAELLIALAGPAVNFALAAGLWSLTVLSGGLVGWWAVELLWVNLALGLFNLIPAFPMDGGRVFRALLSTWLGRLRATKIAAGLGQLLAITFGLFCAAQGEWRPAILALFIYFAARMELAHVAAEAFRGRYVGDPGHMNAPPGYRWIKMGEGAWQLAPIVVAPRDGLHRGWS
jgi:Zn-dependent protease